MAESRFEVGVETFGPTSRAAVRALLDEFRARRWDDAGAALAVVRYLETHGSASPRAAAASVPSDFLVRNRVSRAQIKAMLAQLAARSVDEGREVAR